MDVILNKYNSLIEVLNPKQKRYIHFKSLKNFILYLPELKVKEDKQNSEKKIIDYLEIIEQNIDEINGAFTTDLYTNYIYPLGNTYKKIGFKKIISPKYLIIFSLPVDLTVGILFWRFPYPILTLLVLLNYYWKQKKYIKTSKAFGMFY